VTAADGVEAMNLFVVGEVDLVLTDLSMPRMNGEQLAAAIKSRAPHVPVIMITGFGAMLLPTGKEPDNVDLLLSKPVSAADLTRAIVRTMKACPDLGTPAAAWPQVRS
jgi:YesN/AraC family two-component response regulator